MANFRAFKSTSKDPSAETVAAYYIQVTDQGYQEGTGEPPGKWAGYASAALQVEGVVAKNELANLLSGLTADGKQSLIPNLKSNRILGFEFSFHAPPDVSDLFAVGSLEVIRILNECQELAIRETLWLLQENIKMPQLTTNGSQIERVSIVFATFSRCTANNKDPDLHSHVVVPNIAISDSGTVLELNASEMLRWSQTLQPLFRNSLCCNLVQRLQAEARPSLEGKLTSSFGLRGMPIELSEKASWRNIEILEKDRPIGNPNASANLKPDRIDLHRKWTEEARSLGLTRESFADALGRTHKFDVGDRLANAIKSSTFDLTRDDKSFERPEFIKAVSEKLQDVPITGSGIVAVVDKHLQESHELRVLVRDGQPLVFSSKSLAKMEIEVSNLIYQLNQTPGLNLNSAIVDKAIESRPQLASEEKEAIRHFLNSSNSLACIEGQSRDGIAESVKVVCETYKEQGFKVVGIATSQHFAQELQTNIGVEFHSLESFEKNTNRGRTNGLETTSEMYDTIAISQLALTIPILAIDKKCIVVVDESQSLDTEQAKRVLKIIDSTGAKLIACGSYEHAAIPEKGFAFHVMTEQAGVANIPHNLVHVKLKDCFERLAKTGDLKIFANQSVATRAMIDDWSKGGGIDRPQESAIVTQSHEEAERLNVLCQSERLQKGTISQPTMRFGDLELHINDRIRFPKEISSLGIDSGEAGTVVAVNDRGTINVQLDNGAKVTLNLATISTQDIMLGYSAPIDNLHAQSLGKVYIHATNGIEKQHYEYVALAQQSPTVKVYQNYAMADANLLSLVDATEKRLQADSEQNRLQAHRLSISRYDR